MLTIDDILEEIIDKYTLSNSRFKELKTAYDSIADWIADGDDFHDKYDVEIVPQGSVALGTVIMPRTKDDDIDVDLLCIIKKSSLNNNPKRLKQIVGARLKEHALYSKKLEEGKRCWTISYSGYHLDVLPCVEDITNSNNLIATHTNDYSNYTTTNTSPIAYKKWFFSQSTERRVFLEDAKIVELQQVNRRDDLQKIVQLLKLNRDYWIKKNDINPDDKPISIIITTLAAKSYVSCKRGLFEKLSDVVKTMRQHIVINSASKTPCVLNPVNPKENFADKWQLEPQRQEVFFSWLSQIEELIIKVGQCVNINEISKLLKMMLGEEIVCTAYNSFGARIQDLRIKSNLYCSNKGMLNESCNGKKVEPHTFYGDAL